MNITNLEITQAKLILPNYMDEVRTWIDGGVAREDKELAGKITAMVDALPVGDTMIYGDFHTGNVGAKTDDDAIAAAKEKYGDLYKSEVVLAGDIYFENEDGERITGQPSKDSTDATVVINGVNTEDTDIWMLIYVDSASEEFIITPISDAATLIRFTLPDQFGGKITLLSVKYN